MNVSKRRRGLIAMTTGILVSLALAPQTGWLVRQQTRAVLGARNPALFERAMNNRAPDAAEVSALNAAADRLPGDLGVQMARVEAGRSDWRARVAELQKLEARFPHDPALLANQLRWQTMNLRVGYRPKTQALVYNTRTPEQIRAQKAALALTPESEQQQVRDLVQFEAISRAGAKLAPNNVYFTLLRAASLFGLRRDDEAVAEVLRAGRLSDFDDYSSACMAGRLRLARAAQGDEPGATTDVVLTSGQLYPDIVTQRNAVFAAVWTAMEREQAGKVEEGIAIRLAIARAGETMRAQATSSIGASVGAAMVANASLRAGAAPAFRDADEPKARSRSIERFASYLGRADQGENALWYVAAASAGERTNRIVGQTEEAMAPLSGRAMLPLLQWYTAGLILLWSAMAFALLGLTAHLLMRFSPWVQKGATVSAVTRTGVGAGLAVPLSYFLAFHLGANGVESRTIAMTITALAVGALLYRAKRRARFAVQGLAIAVVTTGAVFAGTTYLPQLGRAAFPVVRGIEQTAGFWAFGAERGGVNGPFTASLAAALFFVFVAYPLTLFALSKRADVPPVLGMLNGLRGLALPLACVAICAYGVVTCVTARKDVAIRADLQQTLRHEGKFLAARLGELWPVRTPPLARP